MRFISACLCGILLIFSVLPRNSFAHSEKKFPDVTGGQINEALLRVVPIRFLPSHPLYFIITTKELVNRIFQPSALKKAEFDFTLSGKRLKEAYLLLQKNDSNNASSTLQRYTEKNQDLVKQIEKARSQNQDATALAAKIGDGLQFHEILFAGIEGKWEMMEDSSGFGQNLIKAVSSFSQTIDTIDKISPGLKNRFKSLKNLEIEKTQPLPSPSPTPFESTPSFKPRRIIY